MQKLISQSWGGVNAQPAYFKVYQRHPEAYTPTRDFLENHGVDLKSAILLHLAICRSDLDVEIEGVFK